MCRLGARTDLLVAKIGVTPPQTGALAGTTTAGSQAGRTTAIAGSGSTSGALAAAAGGGVSSGGAASALLAGTALGDKLQTVQALAPAFQQLGMKQGAVAQFLPVVVSYVKSVGGKSSSKLLTHALGL